MVPETHGDQLLSVGAAHVEGTSFDVCLAQDFLLDLDDGFECCDQGVAHLFRGVLSFPALRPTADGSGQVGHVQGGEVFGVRGAVDVLVGGFLDQVEHRAADLGEVGDQTVVHDGVAAENEGVVVDCGHGSPGGGPDVGEDGGRGRVAADAVEVGVVGGRLAVLVDGWADAVDRGDE